jgi:hypothetical protein
MKHLAANMPLVISYLVVPLLAAALVVGGMEPSSPPAVPPAHCPKKCGNISIPYPFGIGEGCSRNMFFNISCNHGYNPPRAYYGNGFEVMNITLDAAEMRVYASIAYLCSPTTLINKKTNLAFYNFSQSSAFVISPTTNEFTGIGCRNMALLQGKDRNHDGGYLSGCITTCASLDDAAKDGEKCAGNGCCQTAMPGGLNEVTVGNWSDDSGKIPDNIDWNYSSCIYGFIAEKGWFV